MRIWTTLALALAACGTPGTNPDDTEDTDVAPACAEACGENASCVGEGDAATCACDDGYEGDGTTCTDIDECATGNGGCDDFASCTNLPGSSACDCFRPYDGDGLSCDPADDPDRRACAVQEAEHPGYTNLAGNVALCGSKYTSTNLDEACHTGWHVCTESEWLARYPTARPYKTDPSAPDLIGPTLGPVTSWGVLQSERCAGGVWIANAPEETEAYDLTVCHEPDDVGTNSSGADYLPKNDGKFLYADDGTTILQGVNAEGTPDCCSWDVRFETTEATEGFAVYCCADAP